ncbi:hypothetical protein HaLaN_30865 [Haematococcus lacustris]|uniref:Uncharacterized protein n=1 Tax=Haematococcus lacustris TaxID=44745 RepID=A0A6A0AFS4_HAELA|nr:hypothetical protein HaLaN_26904 [Haematococcus lacustris]GFH31759.1 hypothetical protein HaLaN_30865 [Haematococcus lacustris]
MPFSVFPTVRYGWIRVRRIARYHRFKSFRRLFFPPTAGSKDHTQGRPNAQMSRDHKVDQVVDQVVQVLKCND